MAKTPLTVEILKSIADKAPVPHDRVDREYVDALDKSLTDALGRFRSSQSFLERLEESKASDGPLDAETEREAHARANAASGDMRMAVISMLHGMRHMRAGGVIEASMQRLHALAEQSGEVRLSELWGLLKTQPGVVDALAERGLSPDDAERLDRGIEAQDMIFRVRGEGMVAQLADDSGPTIPIMTERNVVPQSARQLWRQDILSATMTALEDPGTIGLEVFGASDFDGAGEPRAREEPLDPLEMFATFGALAAQEAEAVAEAVRWGGLPVVRGRDPWILIGLAVLAGAVVLASVVVMIICKADDDFENDHPDLCDAASWLSIIGILVVIGTSCAADDHCQLEIVVRSKGQRLLSKDGAVGPLA